MNRERTARAAASSLRGREAAWQRSSSRPNSIKKSFTATQVRFEIAPCSSMAPITGRRIPDVATVKKDEANGGTGDVDNIAVLRRSNFDLEDPSRGEHFW